MSGSRVSYLAKPVQEARGRGSRQQGQELGPRWGLPPRPHWPGPLGLGQARGAPVPQALCVGGDKQHSVPSEQRRETSPWAVLPLLLS